MVKPFKAIPGTSFVRNFLDFSYFGKYSFEHLHLAKKDCFAKYGPIYKTAVLPGVYIVQILDPQDHATLFRADDKCPLRPAIPIVTTAHRRDGYPLGLGELNGDALYELRSAIQRIMMRPRAAAAFLPAQNAVAEITYLNGDAWYELRSATQRIMMRPRAAAAFLPAQNAVADRFVGLLTHNLGESGEVSDFQGTLLKYTLESIAVVCFGKETGCLNTEITPGSEADIMIRESSRLFQAVQKTSFAFPWYALFRTSMYRQFLDAKGKCDRVAQGHIDETLNSLHGQEAPTSASGQDSPTTTSPGGECPHFLSTLLASNLETRQIVGITTDLFTAGIDSTANALSFVLYSLSRNPDKQETLYRELEAELRPNSSITTHDFDRLPYLKAAVKESFRLNFPVEGGTTRILSKDVALSGYEVPKGTIVACNNQSVCLDERYFERATEYLPERWLKHGGATLSPPPSFVMLPFGYGPRMCIGRRFAEQEIYLALIKILQAFKVEYCGTEDVGMINRVFSMPDRPIRVRLIKR